MYVSINSQDLIDYPYVNICDLSMIGCVFAWWHFSLLGAVIRPNDIVSCLQWVCNLFLKVYIHVGIHKTGCF